MAAIFQPIEARAAPNATEGLVPWIKQNLIADWKSAVATLIILVLAVLYLPDVLNWTLLKAVFRPSLEECSAARGTGACFDGLKDGSHLSAP